MRRTDRNFFLTSKRGVKTMTNFIAILTHFPGGYGTWTRGARVVNLHLENLTEVRSYIRLEDGSIVDKFPKIETNKSPDLSHQLRNVTAIMLASLIGERIMNYSRFAYWNEM